MRGRGWSWGVAEVLEGTHVGDLGEVRQVDAEGGEDVGGVFEEVWGCGWCGGGGGWGEGVVGGGGEAGAEEGAGEAFVIEVDFEFAAKGLEVVAGEGDEVVAEVVGGEEGVDA